MQSVRNVLKVALVAGAVALPFWGVFGFLLVSLVTATVGSFMLLVAPIFFDD